MSDQKRVRRFALTRSEPAEIVILDEPEPCPYLPGRTARLPMRLPVRRLTRGETDERMASGDRRYGRLFYRTECPECRACEPLRVPVESFVPSRSQRRALLRGDRELRTEVGEPAVTPRRLEIYEKHKRHRGLASALEEPLDAALFEAFLVDRSVEAMEFRFWNGETLVGFGICDQGAQSLSAVYCAFDPDYSHLSIGTYSILKHIELARAQGLAYVYLGLHIAENSHVSYKARFVPHERLIAGTWRQFDGYSTG
jgi:arginine-tRNA-protein transferase